MKNLAQQWDLIVVGGGITGAGIFREAVRMGLSVLLVEQSDFAWGTSSRSSKLIHGGLRYLKEGRIRLTREAVKERERLVKEVPGLVERIEFLVPVYKGRGVGKLKLEAGLSIYDLIAGKRQHKYFDAEKLAGLEPHMDRNGLLGGFRFFDAQTDDARLVLRLIFEAVAAGGRALNYTSADAILRDERGAVDRVEVRDRETGETRVLSTRVVINATGCWAETLQASPERGVHLRPLKGSHLVFPAGVLPISHAISYPHPRDERDVFLLPWEGVVLAGTTDLDHGKDLFEEPVISREEKDYLLEGIRRLFPALNISEKDCLATFAGVRPVLSEGNLSPSSESREHAVWKDRGLVTVTGGKLTTFRKLALDAIREAREYFPPDKRSVGEGPVFDPSPGPPESPRIPPLIWKRLAGRYGEAAVKLVKSAEPGDLEAIPGTQTLWAELPYAAAHEGVRHLDDLLLRRVRVGLLLPGGACEYLGRVKELCRPVLFWDRKEWKNEIERYMEYWKRVHAPHEDIPLPGPSKGLLARIRARLGSF